MRIYKDSFFRIFQPELRGPLQRFFENRNAQITRDVANEFMGAATLDKLVALQLVEHDIASGDYRLDDRVERFFDEMLGAVEVAQAEWLVALLEEMNRIIEGHQKLSDPRKGEALLRRVCRLLRTALSRIQRHLEDIKSSADYDYRAGSDYEVKLMKLQWHLDRSRSYGNAVAELDGLLRNNAYFQLHQEIELLSLRSRVIQTCGRVGDALIDVYQCIEDYLNRVMRDHGRARKLIRLRGLIERHEHLTATNLAELAARADGPWFHEIRIRTLLDVAVIDNRPDLLERALARAGMAEATKQTRRVELREHPFEELAPVIDWSHVRVAFASQPKDLFTFLASVRVEGRELTEEERIDGYCAILCNEDWAETWDSHPFSVAAKEGWEYAVVNPPKS